MSQLAHSTNSAFEPYQRTKEAINNNRKNRKNAFNNLREMFKCNLPNRVFPCPLLKKVEQKSTESTLSTLSTLSTFEKSGAKIV